MNLSLGIVGLPNVGKSTLFNALTKQAVLAENYPFSTIDPNVGVVAVSDERLTKIALIANPSKLTPAIVEFVDIAGLVKGAANGEGLGNKFLSNIKEVSAIVHLIRGFKNSNITHVENSVNMIRDIELINTELILKDVDTVEHRIKSAKTKSKYDKDLSDQIGYMEKLLVHLNAGKLAIDFTENTTEKNLFERRSLFLLTDKSTIYLVNVEDEFANEAVIEIKKIVGDRPIISMDIKIEAELASMEEEDRKMFMVELNIPQTGLEKLTKEAYKTLGLISFFTEGPEEVRAWTIKQGATAPQAAGTIHTDFEKKFIAADICTYNDFISSGDWVKAKTLGKVRLEGKTYLMRDGDIVIFKHG